MLTACRFMLLTLLPVSIFCQTEIFADDEEPIIASVMVVLGTRAELPCDITPPPLDNLYLVLWYKNDTDIPIYTYDARVLTESVRHRADELHFRSRAHFRSSMTPASLSIGQVEERDEGLYRCRVDFGRSPTRNILVNLTIVVPSQKPKIIDETGREVTSVVGPYDEGASLFLTCVAIGGRPAPEVTWWMESELLDQSYEGTFTGVVQNTLILHRLERHHLHGRLRCEARNANWTEAVIASVQIDLHLRPLMVSINGADKALSAGKRYDLECASVGSRPAAVMTWNLHDTPLPAKDRQSSLDGNITTSIVRITPTAKDHGAVVTCSATNPFMNTSVLETRKQLNVLFPPTAELELGRNLNPHDIEEGDHVYFECQVKSNPPPHRVVWTHEGQIVRHNVSANVIPINQSLVMRGIQRHQAGHYACQASNTEGTGVSNTVFLQIMHKPVCRPGQKTIYGVARYDSVRVRCEADAVPDPVSFRWAFNASTAEVIDLPSHLHSQDGNASFMTYSPQAERDYGSLLCWANNAIGQQTEPCVFYIIQGGRPDAPSNCSVTNQTSETLEVTCKAGFDGGLAQRFALEAFNLVNRKLLSNSSNIHPQFRVSNLEADMKIALFVYALNAKGRSPAVTLEGYTLKAAEKQTVVMESNEFASVLGITVGVSVTVFIICIGVVLAARVRRPMTRRNRLDGGDNRSKAMAVILDKEKSEREDEDPDVIPGRRGEEILPLDVSRQGTPDLATQYTTQPSFEMADCSAKLMSLSVMRVDESPVDFSASAIPAENSVGNNCNSSSGSRIGNGMNANLNRAYSTLSRQAFRHQGLLAQQQYQGHPGSAHKHSLNDLHQETCPSLQQQLKQPSSISACTAASSTIQQLSALRSSLNARNGIRQAFAGGVDSPGSYNYYHTLPHKPKAAAPTSVAAFIQPSQASRAAVDSSEFHFPTGTLNHQQSVRDPNLNG